MLDNPLDEVFLEKDKLATQPSTAELLPLTEKLLSEVCSVPLPIVTDTQTMGWSRFK